MICKDYPPPLFSLISPICSQWNTGHQGTYTCQAFVWTASLIMAEKCCQKCVQRFFARILCNYHILLPSFLWWHIQVPTNFVLFACVIYPDMDNPLLLKFSWILLNLLWNYFKCFYFFVDIVCCNKVLLQSFCELFCFHHFAFFGKPLSRWNVSARHNQIDFMPL